MDPEPIAETPPAPAPAPVGSGRTLALGLLVTAALIVAAGFLSLSGRQPDAPPQDAPPQGTLPQDTSPEDTQSQDEPSQETLADRVAPTDVAPLPDFALPGFRDDRPVTAADYAGTPLVLNFWATWCEPCVEEMAMLDEVAGELNGDVRFLGVNVRDDHDKAVALADRLGIGYDLAIDRDEAFFRDVRGFGMPTTVFVDASGMIRYRFTGLLTADQVRDLVATHLGQPTGAGS